MAPNLSIAVVVLEEEHLTRAAQRLGIPQPTVSHAMRRVNDAFGTPLAHRVGRGILATPAGRAFLPAAREALAVLRAARLELADVVDPDWGQVSLGFLHTLGVRDVPRLLDAFLAAYPDVHFVLTQGPAVQILERMRAGALDVVITAPVLEEGGTLRTVVLRDETLFLTVPVGHRLARRKAVDLREAAGERFNALTPRHGLRQVFDELCAVAGFEPELAFLGEDVATLRGLVGTGVQRRPNAKLGRPADTCCPEQRITPRPTHRNHHRTASKLIGGSRLRGCRLSGGGFIPSGAVRSRRSCRERCGVCLGAG